MLIDFIRRLFPVATITINGTTYTGKSISFDDHSVTIDGVRVEGSLQGIVEVVITEGAIDSLRSNASVKASNCKINELHAGGSATCGDVGGSVAASGSVNCRAVTGDVKAGGSVNCGAVGGSIRAGGSIRYR